MIDCAGPTRSRRVRTVQNRTTVGCPHMEHLASRWKVLRWPCRSSTTNVVPDEKTDYLERSFRPLGARCGNGRTRAIGRVGVAEHGADPTRRGLRETSSGPDHGSARAHADDGAEPTTDEHEDVGVTWVVVPKSDHTQDAHDWTGQVPSAPGRLPHVRSLCNARTVVDLRSRAPSTARASETCVRGIRTDSLLPSIHARATRRHDPHRFSLALAGAAGSK